MWLECVSHRAYASREALAKDVVRARREELLPLLAAGPGRGPVRRTGADRSRVGPAAWPAKLMCGALSAKRAPQEELAFAASLLNQVVAGAPRERTAIHICSWAIGAVTNPWPWPGLPPAPALLCELQVGTYFLGLCTPRAGELAILRDIPADRRIGAHL